MSAQRERTRMMREPNSATIYSAALHIPVNGLDSQNAILIFILNYLLFFDHSKEVLLTGWLRMTFENLSNQILANSKSHFSFWWERRKFTPLQYLLENVGLARRELFKNSSHIQRKCYLISASCAALFFTEYLLEYKRRGWEGGLDCGHHSTWSVETTFGTLSLLNSGWQKLAC